MTKKHFKALAEGIRQIQDPTARFQAANAVAIVCEDENPNFDRNRFYAACGLKPVPPAR